MCPQTKIKAAYQGERVMTLDTFRRVIGKLPLDVQIDFSGYAEPFLNPSAGEMIALACGMGFKVHCYSTLIGLTERQVEATKGQRIAFWKVHVPDTQHMVYNAEAWLKLHDRFLSIGIPASYMTMGEMEKPIKEHFDVLGIAVEQPTMLSRAGNLWDRPKHGEKVICSMDRWHQNVVLPNGDVQLCCMDYGLESKVGNLLAQPYDKIYAEAERLREAKSPDLCRSCEWGRSA